MEFQHISTDKGLSQKTAQSIFQDSHGFIWIGTREGLNRYDGQEIVTYRNIVGDIKSLSSNFIRDILEDSQHNIWVATNSGLNRFDASSKTFMRVGIVDKENQPVVRLTSLFDDNNGRILIGTEGQGVYSVDTSQAGYKVKFVKQLDDLRQANVQVIFKDSKGRYWFGTHSQGAWLANDKGKISINFQFEKNQNNSISHNNIHAIMEDSDGRIWIGTEGGGLNKYNELNKSFIRYQYDLNDPTSLSNNRVFKIIEDKNQILWIATDGGINLYRPSSDDFLRVQYRPSQPAGLSHNEVTDMLEDDGGLIWIGTVSGINIWNPVTAKFVHYRNISEDSNSLSNNFIRGLEESKSGNIYAATVGGGLNVLDTTSGKWTVISKDKQGVPLLLDLRVNTLMVDSTDDLWVGTYSRGVSVLSRDHQLLQHFEHNKQEPKSLSANGIRAILQDSDNEIWIATSRGINRLNRDGKTFKHYRIEKNNRNTLISENIVAMLEDDEGYIWLATDGGGLSRLDKNNGNFINITHQPDNPFSLTSNQTISIYQDSQARFWIGTELGLNRWEPEDRRQAKNRFTHYTTKNGLSSSTINGVLEDEEGFIWISTNKGVSRLDPENDQFKHYNLALEIQNNELNQNSMLKAENGRLYFGGLNGINAFFPKEIDINNNIPPVVLTNISSENKSLSFTLPLTNLEGVNFTHKDYFITFEFAALDYAQPGKNQYQYKLDGFDPDWIHINNLNRATYTNLPSGKYIFKVKASNNDNVWSDESINLIVIIEPAPWASPWAFALYIFTVLISIFMVIQFRTRRLESHSIKLEKSIDERTRELATEKHKVERLLALKNEEFANVSHEFRTPLTLILGPLAQVLKTNKNQQEIDRLNIVQRNGYRLLRMVDQLLNAETFRVKAITQKSPLASGKVIEQITDAFKDLAKQKNIDIRIKQIDHINLEFTPDALEKIILNLLSNAIKYTKSGGTITVSSRRNSNNELEVKITDTGIGIPEDKLGSVFERYQRVLDENSEQVSGAGLGLALVKDIVESHQGRVEIESQLGKGTQVVVYLPIVVEVDDCQVSNQSNDEIVAMELMSLTSQPLVIEDQTEKKDTEHKNNNPTVLVIEDNQDMRDYILASINDDYQVLTAKDGVKGLEIAISEVPDIIICDVMMPKKDGY